MNDKGNPKARQLYNVLLGHTDIETALGIVDCVPLSKIPSDSKKLQWVNASCAKLKEAFDEATVQAIREHCSCTPPAAKLVQVKRMYEEAANLTDFCDRFNRAYTPGNQLFTEEGALFLCYPTCYCSFVKNIDATVPTVWCACSLGYAKKMFSHAFSREVTAELIESVKTGGGKCVIKMILL